MRSPYIFYSISLYINANIWRIKLFVMFYIKKKKKKIQYDDLMMHIMWRVHCSKDRLFMEISVLTG